MNVSRNLDIKKLKVSDEKLQLEVRDKKDKIELIFWFSSNYDKGKIVLFKKNLHHKIERIDIPDIFIQKKQVKKVIDYEITQNLIEVSYKILHQILVKLKDVYIKIRRLDYLENKKIMRFLITYLISVKNFFKYFMSSDKYFTKRKEEYLFYVNLHKKKKKKPFLNQRKLIYQDFLIFLLKNSNLRIKISKVYLDEIKFEVDKDLLTDFKYFFKVNVAFKKNNVYSMFFKFFTEFYDEKVNIKEPFKFDDDNYFLIEVESANLINLITALENYNDKLIDYKFRAHYFGVKINFEEFLMEIWDSSKSGKSLYGLLYDQKRSFKADEELSRLRIKIIDAIRFSKRYWLIYREGTFGFATILNLIYKRSYVEVLFFTNKTVLELGVPLLKIYTPIETEIDFNEVLLEPDFDEDGLVSPSKIIKRLNKTIKKEFRYHLSILDAEVQLIDEKFENFAIEKNPYNREINIYFPEFVLSLSVNFEEHPLLPRFSFSKSLSKIIQISEFNEIDIIKNWDVEIPLHVVDLIEVLIDLIVQKLKIDNLNKDSQHLLLENLTISNEIFELSFKIHRGRSLGIVYRNIFFPNDILAITNLFNTIAGKNQDFLGKIKIFGRHVQLTTRKEMDRIIILSNSINSRMEKMTIKKAIRHNIRIVPIWKSRKRSLEKAMKRVNLMLRRDEIMAIIEEQSTLVSQISRWRNKKNFIEEALQVSGLVNKKKEKISRLSPLYRLLFSISRALLKSPNIIMFSLPSRRFDRLEFSNFQNYLDKIKKMFHVSFIIHCPEEIFSSFNQILTITEVQNEIGTLNDFLKRLPHSGEILSIELNNPSEKALGEMFELSSTIFLEERKNEKYKIISFDDHDKIIFKLMKIFGPSLFNFKKLRASLEEYLLYMELKKGDKLMMVR